MGMTPRCARLWWLETLDTYALLNKRIGINSPLGTPLERGSLPRPGWGAGDGRRSKAPRSEE